MLRQKTDSGLVSPEFTVVPARMLTGRQEEENGDEVSSCEGRKGEV